MWCVDHASWQARKQIQSLQIHTEFHKNRLFYPHVIVKGRTHTYILIKKVNEYIL